MMPGEVYFKYCDRYVGGSSRVPLAKLISEGYDKHCPLLKDKRCSVHKAKPTVCALYPLGRGINTQTGENMETKDIYYILQPADCNCNPEKHTVREWLNSFGIPIEDQFYVDWMSFVSELSKQFAVSMTLDAFCELMLATQAHYQAWLTAWYMGGCKTLQPKPAKQQPAPTQQQTPPSQSQYVPDAYLGIGLVSEDDDLPF